MLSLLLHELQLYAPVEIAGRLVFAHLDTGASLDVAFAVGEGIAEEDGEAPIRGAIGEVQLRRGRVAEVNFLGETLRDLPVLISPGLELRKVPLPVMLRFGGPTLLRRPLLLDFKGLRIAYQGLPDDVPRTTAPLTLAKGVPFFTLEVGGRSLRAAFDIGAGITTVNAAHAGEWLAQAEIAYDTPATDPTGQTRMVPVGVLRSLRVGEVSLGDTEYLTWDLSPIEEKLGTRLDIVLGLNTMLSSSTVWALDTEAGRLEVTRRGLPG